MSKKTYMLDTNICSFIMRKKPDTVLEELEKAVDAGHRIVVSAITYSEMRFGAVNPKSSPKVAVMVDSFIKRLNAILPWDAAAVDVTTQIRTELFRIGMPIGHNDTAIAGHAIATKSILVTNNTREFTRVDGLQLLDWSIK